MNKELKFRAWDHDNDKMIFWSLTDLLVRFGEPEYQYNVKDRPSFLFDWMDYTNLKDKNNKDVYELDIILLNGKKYLVVWSYDNASFCFRSNYRSRSKEPDRPDHDIIGGFHNCNEFEVIGNWYENPEITEVGMMEDVTRKSLLQLPEREWDTKSIYDSIILINSRKKNNSGYTIMYIVGCINNKPIEIISDYCDTINWQFNGLKLGTDMLYPSGLTRFFGVDCKIEVGASLSTTCIKLIKKAE